MTRDLDIVVALDEHNVAALVAAFAPNFYVDADAARAAVLAERMFSLNCTSKAGRRLISSFASPPNPVEPSLRVANRWQSQVPGLGS